MAGRLLRWFHNLDCKQNHFVSTVTVLCLGCRRRKLLDVPGHRRIKFVRQHPIPKVAVDRNMLRADQPLQKLVLVQILDAAAGVPHFGYDFLKR